MMAKKQDDFTVVLTDAVLEKIDQRMIRNEDIYDVIEAVRCGAPTIYEKDTGDYLAACRFGNVTFWVRYAVEGDRYLIRSAYSHRMCVE
jgi:hypothetical protein